MSLYKSSEAYRRGRDVGDSSLRVGSVPDALEHAIRTFPATQSNAGVHAGCRPAWPCDHCGRDVYQIILRDDIWFTKFADNPDAMLCWSCIAFRLGRPLRVSDLKAAPINEPYLVGVLIAGQTSGGASLYRLREDVRRQFQISAQWDELQRGNDVY